MTQIENSLDSVTKSKIIRGAFYAFMNAGILAFITFLAGYNFNDPMIAMLVVSFVIPTLTNVYKEYKAGHPEYGVPIDNVGGGHCNS